MRLLGQVKDNKDPNNCQRVKVHIPGYNHLISVDKLEWCEQRSTTHSNTHQLPALEEWVEIDTTAGMTWSFPDLNDKALIELIKNDYLSSIVIVYRNLAQQDSSGEFAIMWTQTNGFQVFIDKSMYQIEQNGNLHMTNSKKVIHIKDETISLGSKDKSAEPAVLGDKNFEALNQLNDNLKALSDSIDASMTKLFTAAVANPYTSALAPEFKALGTKAKSVHSGSDYQKAKKSFPPTKSKIVNLD